MNDFLVTELAREHQARLAKQAEAAVLVRAAEAGTSRRRRRGMRSWLRPRNG